MKKLIFFKLLIMLNYKKKKLTLFFLPSSLKMECEKLAQEKTEMQRHYVMVSKFCE